MHAEVLFGAQTGQRDKAQNIAVLGVDRGNRVGQVDVGEDCALNEFQLVQIFNRLPLVAYPHLSHDLHCARIKPIERVCAVGEDEGGAIGGEPPALGLVMETAQMFESVGVINKAGIFLPGELIELAIEQDQPFSKVFGVQRDFRQNASVSGVNLAQRGFAVKTAAFVKNALIDNQPLSVTCGIMGMGGEEFIAEGLPERLGHSGSLRERLTPGADNAREPYAQ